MARGGKLFDGAVKSARRSHGPVNQQFGKNLDIFLYDDACLTQKADVGRYKKLAVRPEVIVDRPAGNRCFQYFQGSQLARKARDDKFDVRSDV